MTINEYTYEDAYYKFIKGFARDDIILMTEEGPLSIIFLILRIRNYNCVFE
jgi:hypothetical protein